MTTPTDKTYESFLFLFDLFNKKLFDSNLTVPLITLQRKGSALGYFSHKRFVNDQGESAHELALNPEYFASLGKIELFQTVVHEMCHLWQYDYGKPSRAGYHNKEWVEKMHSVGLKAISADSPNGTGQRVCDEIIPDGPLDLLIQNELVEMFSIPYYDRYQRGGHVEALDLINNQILQHITAEIGIVSVEAISDAPLLESNEQKPRKQTRAKFVCPRCQAAAWGKPSLYLICGDCKLPFEIQPTKNGDKK